jgi:hypothetical protein
MAATTYGRANLLVQYKPKPYTYRAKTIPGGRDKELVAYRVQGDVKAQVAHLTKLYKKMGGKGGLVYATNEESVKWMARNAVVNLDAKSKAHGRPQNFRTGKLARTIRSPKSHIVSTVGFRFMVEKQVRAQIAYAFSLEYGDRSQIGRNIYFLFLGKGRDRSKPARANKKVTQNDADRVNFARKFNHHGSNAESYRTSHRPKLTRSTHPYFGVQHHTAAHGANANRTSDRIIGPRELHTGGRGGGAMRSGFITNGKRYRVTIKNPVPQYRYGRDAGDKFVNESVYLDLLMARYKKGPEAEGVVMVPGVRKAAAASKKAARSKKKAFGPKANSGNAKRVFPVSSNRD